MVLESFAITAARIGLPASLAKAALEGASIVTFVALAKLAVNPGKEVRRLVRFDSWGLLERTVGKSIIWAEAEAANAKPERNVNRISNTGME